MKKNPSKPAVKTRAKATAKAKPARTPKPHSGGTGGARPGAGRPKGSKNRSTKVIEALAAGIEAGKAGSTPLEVMVETMQKIVDKARAAEAAGKDVALVAGKAVTVLNLRLMAVDVAAKAAPYVHPKLVSAEAKVEHSFEDLLDLAEGLTP